MSPAAPTASRPDSVILVRAAEPSNDLDARRLTLFKKLDRLETAIRGIVPETGDTPAWKPVLLILAGLGLVIVAFMAFGFGLLANGAACGGTGPCDQNLGLAAFLYLLAAGSVAMCGYCFFWAIKLLIRRHRQRKTRRQQTVE